MGKYGKYNLDKFGGHNKNGLLVGDSLGPPAEKMLPKELTVLGNFAAGRFEEIAIGFADESAPQLTANTLRVWSFGKPQIRKNTQKIRANAMSFYPRRGRAAREFAVDSKIERSWVSWKR